MASELTKVSSVVVEGRDFSTFEGFTLQSVSFADVKGNGKEDAIVVLLYHSGGTQQTHYVYVFSFEGWAAEVDGVLPHR